MGTSTLKENGNFHPKLFFFHPTLLTHPLHLLTNILPHFIWNQLPSSTTHTQTSLSPSCYLQPAFTSLSFFSNYTPLILPLCWVQKVLVSPFLDAFQDMFPRPMVLFLTSTHTKRNCKKFSSDTSSMPWAIQVEYLLQQFTTVPCQTTGFNGLA